MSAGRKRFVVAVGERAKGAVGPGGAGGRLWGTAQQHTPALGCLGDPAQLLLLSP